MIKMTKGVYCHKAGNAYVDETVQSKPFCLSSKEEKELVDKGCAVYVTNPIQEKSAVSCKGKNKRKDAPERPDRP